MADILQVEGLETQFRTQEGMVHAVNGVSFRLKEGETLGIVGESGCGKSVTMMSMMRLIPVPPGKVVAGSALYQGKDLLKLSDAEIRDIRGYQISVIFQDPMTSFNPVLTIGRQVAEPLEIHMGLTTKQSYDRAAEVLSMVGIPNAKDRLNDYPHQFSGGMRQRAMIAMALVCTPQILIADEPTTALDVTIQAQIVELVKRLRDELGMSMIWITHDLGIIAGLAHRVAVMYAGYKIEEAPVKELYANPQHPYTIGLLSSLPRMDDSSQRRLTSIEGMPPVLFEKPNYCPFAPALPVCPRTLLAREPAIDTRWARALRGLLGESRQWGVSRMTTTQPVQTVPTVQNDDVLLRVQNLVKYFPITRHKFGILTENIGAVHAVDDVSFDLIRGETLGLVGESGCGKSTTGRTILQLYRPTSGHVFFEDHDLVTMKGENLRKMRRRMQMIFQDPYASLNPRMTVGEIIGEPIVIHGIANQKEADKLVKELLKRVGLNPAYTNRYPHEFSGGQRQRIGIARSLALQPALIVCDEPISALDVSIQAQVVNLLEDLQKEFNLTYLFIAHDLSMIRHISNRVAVMYLGIIVELTTRAELYANPLHPYTQALLSAVPIPDPMAEERRQRIILQGDVPSPVNPPSGCRFRTRCPLATKICAEVRPDFREVSPGHWAACHLV